MKTKITIIAFLMCLFTIHQESQSQIIVHDDGQITFQHNNDDWYHGVQILPSGCTHFSSSEKEEWHWVTIASPKHYWGKCWIVNYPDMNDSIQDQKDDHRFFVTGEGRVFKRGNWTLADIDSQADHRAINNPNAILDGITGTYYVPTDEITDGSKGNNVRVGVIAQDVEKVLPEAVTTDDQDRMYVDYEALTVVLIEAYKEQKAEIELLRKTLEEHGLLEPKE